MRLAVSGAGAGNGSPTSSALSAAITAAPPELAITPTPAADGRPALENSTAVSSMSSQFAISTTPVLANAAL